MNTLILCCLNRAPMHMPGAELQGCKHDIIGDYRWAYENLLPGNEGNINVVVLGEEKDTSANEKVAIAEAIKAAGPKEWVYYKKSSHGADPGLVCYDSDWNDDKRTFMSAQTFGELFAKANPQTRLFMSIDACVFGDSLRALLGPDRVLVPKGLEDATSDVGVKERDVDPNEPHFCIPRGIANLVTLAGCQKGGTCADVRDSGGAYGAFSHFELPHRQGHTVAEICAAVNADLQRNQFEQRAVFTGPSTWKWCAE